MSVTVFTYGDPDPAKAERLGAWLQGACTEHATILGHSFSTSGGDWGGVSEATGALVVAGLTRAAAARIGSRAAGLYDQDAVGVVHDDEGRTLATPRSAPALRTAEEVWA